MGARQLPKARGESPVAPSKRRDRGVLGAPSVPSHGPSIRGGAVPRYQLRQKSLNRSATARCTEPCAGCSCGRGRPAGSGIVPLVGQREAAGVPQHVRMGWEAQAGGLTSALHELGKPACGERRATLGREHERRLAAPARAAACAVPVARRRGSDGWRGVPCLTLRTCRTAAGEVDLVPAKVDQFADP